MTLEIGSAVQYQDANGVVRAAILAHVFPHHPEAEAPDPHVANLVTVSADSTELGPWGRTTVILKSVVHRDAAPANAPCWFEGGQ